MEKLLKLYLKYCIFIILLYACQEKDCKELDSSLQSTKIPIEDLDKARDVILEGLKKQIPKTSEIYQRYVNEIFQMSKDSCQSIYFYNIHEGLATLHYEFIHSNIHFTLVRNSVGKYYYIGTTDKFVSIDLIEPYFLEWHFPGITFSKDYILRSFDLTPMSHDVKVINQILKEEPRLRNNFKSRYNYLQKIDLIHYFLCDLYEAEPNVLFLFEDNLINLKLVTDLKKNLLEMQFDRPDTANVENLIKNNDYEKLAYYYPNKKAIFLRKKFIGIIVLIVNYCKEEDYFYLEKHFIPSCELIYLERVFI